MLPAETRPLVEIKDIRPPADLVDAMGGEVQILALPKGTPQ